MKIYPRLSSLCIHVCYFCEFKYGGMSNPTTKRKAERIKKKEGGEICKGWVQYSIRQYKLQK